MTSEDAARLGEAAAEAVRAASGQQRLLDCEEVLEALEAEGQFAEADATGLAEARALLPDLLAAHPDLAALQGRSGKTLYHAPRLLSRTYADILDRKGSPLLLLAEEIRANSRDYPRPVPLELFEGPPFNLAPGDVACALAAMDPDPEYGDIRSIRTDSGAVYLFSVQYLEPGYAVFLARREESWTTNP